MNLQKVTFASRGPPVTHTRNLPNCAFRQGQISLGSIKPQESGDEFEARYEERGLTWLLNNRLFIQKQKNKVFQLLIFNIEKKRTSYHLQVHWATGYSICYLGAHSARFAVASVLHVLELHKRQRFMASFDQHSIVSSLNLKSRYKNEQELQRGLQEQKARLGLIQLRVKQQVLQLRKQTLRQLEDRHLLEPLKSLQPLPSLDYLEFQMLEVPPLASFFVVDLSQGHSFQRQAVLIGYHQHLGSIQFSESSNEYGLTVGCEEDLILPLGLFINEGLSVGYLQIISENQFFVCYQGNTNFGSSGGPILGANGILAHNLGHFDDRLGKADSGTLAHFMESVQFQRLVVRRREYSSKNYNIGLKLKNSFTKKLFERLKTQWIKL